jgi:hypothetical protein
MIHLFWAGKGWFVPAITFASCLAMELAVRAVYHDNTYYETHGWPILVALFLAAFLVQIVSRGWVYSRELRDVKTGELVVLRPQHSFLFVHVRFWPTLLCLLGIAFFVAIELRHR